MLHGAITRYELSRDLLAWHALRSTDYKAGTTLRDILGRAPLDLDPRAADAERRRRLRPPSEDAQRAYAMIQAATAARHARGGAPPPRP